MIRTTVLLIALAVAGTTFARAAEKTTMTKSQATELYLALMGVEAGLSPANTVAAADNLNAIRPIVEALDKGKLAFNKAVRAISREQSKDAEQQVEKLADALEAKANESITVDLVPLKLADDEITAAKVKPSVLAVLRRWLKLAEPKKSLP